MPKTVILVVEDDAAIRRGLVDALKYAGYEVIACEHGELGLKTALSADLDLVLLDLVLPGIDGLRILEQLHQSRPNLPVILVTAKGAEEDRIHGLKQGADDYVVKPFSAKELLARVQAVLRRSPGRQCAASIIQIAERQINLERREVELPDKSIRQLSEKETEILQYLASVADRPVSRDELLQRVWRLDPKGLSTRTVDMHIARLREKLSDHQSTIICTVRSKGYILAANAEVTTSKMEGI